MIYIYHAICIYIEMHKINLKIISSWNNSSSEEKFGLWHGKVQSDPALNNIIH